MDAHSYANAWQLQEHIVLSEQQWRHKHKHTHTHLQNYKGLIYMSPKIKQKMDTRLDKITEAAPATP